MLKRVFVLVAALGALASTGCSSGGCGSRTGTPYGGSEICLPKLHCECPCYCRAFQRSTRQMMDVIDVHFLNYNRHDPFQCDPCIGD